MSEIEVRPVDAAHWADVEAVFGKAGADNGCWCQYWLIGARYHERDRAENRRDLKTQVAAGDAGLLAYRDDEPVGWARLTPRSELGWLTTRFSTFEFDGAEAWGLPCFFVPARARGDGVMTALIRAASAWGRDRGVPIEAYPVDPGAPGATRNRFTGVLPTFLAEGFEIAGRLSEDRVVVRTAAVSRR